METTIETKLEPASINRYTGYRHNRYDSYNCSRGILAAMGGSPTADCFADADDYEIDEEIFNGDTPLDPKKVLFDLDILEGELEELKNLQPGGTREIQENLGDYIYRILFENIDGTIYATADADGDAIKYIAEF